MSNLAVFSAERVVTHIVPGGTVIKPGRYLPYVETEPPAYNPATEQLVAVSPIGTAVDLEATEVLQQWEVVARPPHRVSRDTIIMRIKDAGKLPEAMAAVGLLEGEDKFLWDTLDWYWSNNPQVRAMITGIGLDPDEILAPDPFLS